ncbi:MAG: hypothetical protein K8U03_01390 [Planctomycetia bacterium]|nr:hypothetical protein [Planctomycetia bacterium]
MAKKTRAAARTKPGADEPATPAEISPAAGQGRLRIKKPSRTAIEVSRDILAEAAHDADDEPVSTEAEEQRAATEREAANPSALIASMMSERDERDSKLRGLGILPGRDAYSSWTSPIYPTAVNASSVLEWIDELFELLDSSGLELMAVEFGDMGSSLPADCARDAWAIIQRLCELRICDIGVLKTTPSAEEYAQMDWGAGRLELLRCRSVLTGPTIAIPAADERNTFSKSAPQPLVELRGRGQRPLVCGREVSILTPAYYKAVQALVDAGPDGLLHPELQQKGGSEAPKYLAFLVGQRDKNPPDFLKGEDVSLWKRGIRMAQKAGRGYAIEYQNIDIRPAHA